MSEDLKAKARRIYEEVYNKGNLDAVDEIFDASYVRHQSPMQKVEGVEAYKAFISETLAAYTNFEMVVEDILADGNKTIAKLMLTGKNTGRIPTLKTPPTGREIAMPSCVVSTWENGKIVEETAYNDYLGLTYQFGVMPMFPGGGIE